MQPGLNRTIARKLIYRFPDMLVVFLIFVQLAQAGCLTPGHIRGIH
jgi:hypothetical protein